VRGADWRAARQRLAAPERHHHAGCHHSCFDFSGRANKVVLVDLEFPSILIFTRSSSARRAIEIVRNADGIHIPLEKLLAAIDERTLLVPISMVLFRSADILDARAIIERAHHVGAHVVLDVFQANRHGAGDVTALQTDFAVGGVLKWLCGGPGVAYSYVRPDCARSSPRASPAVRAQAAV